MLTVRVRNSERGLFLRYGEYVRVVGPGVHFFGDKVFNRVRSTVEVFSVLDTRLVTKHLELVARDPRAQSELEFVRLTDSQRALVWKDGRLAYILGPGLSAFWKASGKLEVETFDISELRFESPRMDAVLSNPDAKAFLEWVDVDTHSEALLLVNGELVTTLKSGRYVFWKGASKIRLVPVDRREQIADVAGQEIMTSDKVTLRVNLLATYQVVDPVKAVTLVADYAQAIYREAQLALRAAVGTRTLDALLGDKETIGGEVAFVLSKRAVEFGVAIRGVGLKDIILPGEMRVILNQVIEAEKRAQAESIKRREETASARSQANTAKLLAENPVLARMKELEALQAILANTKATFVFGSGDLTAQVKSLVGSKEST